MVPECSATCRHKIRYNTPCPYGGRSSNCSAVVSCSWRFTAGRTVHLGREPVLYPDLPCDVLPGPVTVEILNQTGESMSRLVSSSQGAVRMLAVKLRLVWHGILQLWVSTRVLHRCLNVARPVCFPSGHLLLVSFTGPKGDQEIHCFTAQQGPKYCFKPMGTAALLCRL